MTMPPLFDDDVEVGLLGACLVPNPAAVNAGIAAGVTRTTFGQPINADIWDAIVELHEAGNATDPTSVARAVRANGQTVAVEELVAIEAHAGYLIGSAEHYAATLVNIQQARHDWYQIEGCLNGQFPNRRAVLQEVITTMDARTVVDVASYFVDPAAVLAGDLGVAPKVGERGDGTICMFYAGQLNSIIGESESGKSWLAQWCAVEQLKLHENVVYVDYEKDAASVFGRLILLGATEDDLLRFRYIRAEQAFSPAHLALFVAAVAATAPTVVVFDGVNAALMLEGLSPNSSDDIARFYSGAPYAAQKAGACVILVDHLNKPTKDASAPGAGGSQHKRAGITGASYKMVLTSRFSQTQSGRGYLKVDKDAGGHVRAACPDAASFGNVSIDVEPGQVRITVEPGNPVTTGTDGITRRSGYEDKVSRWLDLKAGVGATAAEVKDSGIQGSSQYLRDALAALVADGYVRKDRRGREVFYVAVKPYREHAPAPDDF